MSGFRTDGSEEAWLLLMVTELLTVRNTKQAGAVMDLLIAQGSHNLLLVLLTQT